jgi:hypothetical protein
MRQLSQKYMKFRTSDSDRSAEAQMVKYSMCELVIFVRDCARIFGSRCSFRFFHSILKVGFLKMAILMGFGCCNIFCSTYTRLKTRSCAK